MGSPSARVKASYVWALSPIVLGCASGPAFLWAARRLRSRSLAVEGAAYVAVTVLAASSPEWDPGDWAGALVLLQMLVATARACGVRQEVFGLLPPEVPRGEMVFRETYPSLGCHGLDRHRISLERDTAAALVACGAALIPLGLWSGIGLVPVTGWALGGGGLLVPLFERRLDGRFLVYRTWGRQRRLDLADVTGVGAPWGTAGSIRLRVRGAPRGGIWLPGAGAMPLSPVAGHHLRGWLDRPEVDMSDRARSALTG